MGTRGVWRLDLSGWDAAAPRLQALDVAAPRLQALDVAAPRLQALDVEVDIAPGATVGDLAQQLADHVGQQYPAYDPHDPESPVDHYQLTLCCGDAVVDPNRPAVSAAPRNGTTIRLARHKPRHATNNATAPVILRTPDGPRQLNYGSNRLAPGISVNVDHTVHLHDEGADHLSVNGIVIRGNRVIGQGDLLRSGGWTATLDVTGVLRPPPPGGPTVPMGVSRGAWGLHDSEPVDLPHPPGRSRSPGFPWLTAAVPLLMAGGAWVVTQSLMLVAFMGFSFVYVVASGIESRFESRAADRFAVAEFREDLSDTDMILTERRREQMRRDETHHPSTDETAGWVNPASHRLWERSATHPHPLVVRLGTAPRGPDDPAIRPERGRPDLRDELDAVCAHNDPAPRPLTIDLAETGGIAVVGDDVATSRFAASIIAQIALLNPPGQLSIRTHDPDGNWDWTDWLPHSASAGEHSLIVAHRDRGVGTPPQDSLRDCANTGRVTVWIASDTVGLPDSIRAVVQFDNHGIATQQLDNQPAVEFTPEFTDRDRLEVVARGLAGFAPGTPNSEADQSLPSAVTIAHLGLPMRHVDVRGLWDQADNRRWGSSTRGTNGSGDAPDSGDHLEFALGAVSGGGILTLDLVRDGPHALVAGTTGAGKSELLRTMALGLAARHSPERLNFFLIDYKGGAAFGPLADLPHCVGLLTDLRGNGAERTLAALRAELRRREGVLEEHSASDAREIQPEARPASLVVIIDEFATLVTEVPGFLDGMLDVAQRGRSLGIHMVLATQRPAGVITDAIRANTSLRIALRLPDEDDSADVISSPRAAGLPREIPGRAMVRLGHDELITVQVAYSGSTPLARPRVRVRELGRYVPWARSDTDPRRDGRAGDRSELELVVDAIRDASKHGPEPEIHYPVPPPLPEFIEFADVGDSADPAITEQFVLGLLDEPETQRVEPLLATPERLGGILALGAPSSGVSSTLRTIAQAALRLGCWEVHAIDATGGLAGLAGDPARCEVVDAADHEPLRRMLERLMMGHGACGADQSTRTRHLLLVDGFGAFEGLQEPINRGWATERLIELAANGRSHGVLVAVGARRRMEIPPSLMHHLGERIVLRMVDGDEATLMDAPSVLASMDLPPGRGWVRGHWAQLISPTPEAHDQKPTEPARLPSMVTIQEVTDLRNSSPADGWVIPIGIGAANLEVAMLDLTDTHALVSGSPGAGCSTALSTIASSAEHAGMNVICSDGGTDTLRSAIQSAKAEPTQRFLVIIDSVDRRVNDPEVAETLEGLIGDPRDSNVRVIAAGDPLALLRCYDDAVLRMRSMRTGLLLGDDAHELGDLLHRDLRRRDDIAPAVGRGWLVHRAGASIVQVAVPV